MEIRPDIFGLFFKQMKSGPDQIGMYAIKEIKMILRLFLVIAMSRQFKPNKINHSTSPAASYLGRKPRYMQ